MEQIKKTFYIMMIISMTISFVFVGWSIVSNVKYNTTDKLAMVDIEGTISENKTFRSVLDKLREFRVDPTIRAVIVRINSGGGEVAPAQELYMELKKLREIKKVFVSIGSKAASGGYYAALGGSRIVAEPGSITGSIGVIMKTTNYATIADRFGVSFNVIKSGKFKDIGDSFREMTSDEKTVLSGMVSNVYGQFVDAIVTERKLDKAKVAALADGRIYTGLEAVSLGLIDGIGTLQDVIELAAAENKMPLKNIVIVQAKSSEGLIEKLFAGASASISNMLADAIRNADISTDDNLKFLFQ